MAASVGNRHMVKASEVEEMKGRGVWGAWLHCSFSMAQLHPSGGAFLVEIVSDETGLKAKPVTFEELRVEAGI